MQGLHRLFVWIVTLSLIYTIWIWFFEIEKYGLNNVHQLVRNIRVANTFHKKQKLTMDFVTFKKNSLEFQNSNISTNNKNTRTLQIRPRRRTRAIPTMAAPTPCVTVPTNQSILSFETDGRLGNQMFSYAALYTISKYNKNYIPYMSPNMSAYLTKYFKTSMWTLQSKHYNCMNWTKIELSRNRELSNSSISNITTQYVMYTGYPESWKYFNEFQSNILKEFEFHDYIQSMSKKKILQIVQSFMTGNLTTVVVVGIHVRRQDYLIFKMVINLELPTLEYYKGAMKYFIKKYKNVIFIISSDDISWCIEHFSLLLIDTTTGEKLNFKINFLNETLLEDGGFDLAVLANCHHVIFGVGTFGFWSGYLNKGEVLFCSDCILPTTGWMKELLDYNNFILPNWKGFDRNGKFNEGVVAKWNLSYS